MKSNVDLTKLEDLSIAVMNLISVEEHLAFTAMKTKKVEYLHVLDSVRELRKNLLKKIVKNTEGELWCISKHLLATTMKLMGCMERPTRFSLCVFASRINSVTEETTRIGRGATNTFVCGRSQSKKTTMQRTRSVR